MSGILNRGSQVHKDRTKYDRKRDLNHAYACQNLMYGPDPDDVVLGENTGIDPNNFTDFDASDWKIQEMFLYAIAVAGKPSMETAWKINNMTQEFLEMIGENPIYSECDNPTGPLHFLLTECAKPIYWIESHKLGKYRTWEDMFYWFRSHIPVSAGYGEKLVRYLRDATVDQLLNIPGVGPKTARFFKLHTERDNLCVPLDTHILKFLAWELRHGAPDWLVEETGDGPLLSLMFTSIPTSTPQGKKSYKFWEGVALELMQDYREFHGLKTLADADLRIWKQYKGVG